ncbi:MAG: hypothetical protein WCG01_02730 [bacterium]
MSTKYFEQLLKDYSYFNKTRREIIGLSADALHKSKIAIFTMHRGQFNEAKILLLEIETIFKNLEKNFKQSPGLRYEGSYRAALEEYAEAKIFCELAIKGQASAIKEIKIDFDTYLAGLCDATGEMVRLATKEATNGNLEEVTKIKDLVTEVIGELVVFNLTSYLRTKYDQAKTNLRRLEQMVYEIKLREIK